MQYIEFANLIYLSLQDFRKALTKMFLSHGMDVVFFEIAIYLNKRPHMVIQCITAPSKDMELIPFYFKKAILECEGEWSHNKKLIDLKVKCQQRVQHMLFTETFFYLSETLVPLVI